MIYQRIFSAKLYAGNKTNYSLTGETSRIADDGSPNLPMIYNAKIAAHYLIAGASASVTLPDDYTNASYLAVIIKTNGILRVAVTSTDLGSSTVLVKGTSTQYGFHMFVQKVDSITITNPHLTDAMQATVCFVHLPDISDVDSFLGFTHE